MQETQVQSLRWEDPLEKGSQVRLVVKNLLSANAGDGRDASLAPEFERSDP